MRRLLATGLVLLAVVSPAWGQTAGPADLVLHNGVVVTVDEQRQQAEAVAIQGDRISAVGSNREIRRLIGDKTRVIDLKGRLAIPGLIEGHGHFLSLGNAKRNLDLTNARDWQDIVQQVAAAVQKAEPGDWIEGRGWHQEKWDRAPRPSYDGYPTHRELSEVSPDNPVLLTHASGHMSIANAKAMSLAGVDHESADPPGGTILRDRNGMPIGVFRETAQRAVSRAHSRWQANRTAAQRAEVRAHSFELATRECLSKGITSFQDAGSSFDTVEYFKQLADQDQLKVRMWVMLRESPQQLKRKIADYRLVDYADGRLTVRAIKCMADGALGAHGAWLLEPYHDLPSSRGLAVQPIVQIKETALVAMEHDFQLCVHAIGDRANREVLNVFEEMYRSFPNRNAPRWRIEHAQHIHPQDIPRFGELGVIASMQANHCTSDGPYVIERLGEQRAQAGAYAWRSLLDSGAVVTNGTDVPVEDVDPMVSFHAAVSRRLNDGSVFFGEQCMSREEALYSYTMAAAYAAFEEDSKGSITPGKLADIVVLSDDIMTIPAEQIPNVRVVSTIVGGQVVYQRSD